MQNLKGKAIWSGVARVFSQAATLVLRLGYLAILARLLSPNDFGLVAMVAVVTGIFDLFTSAGLSSATVQKDAISVQQISTLFWVNILVGAALALLCAASASLIAGFYQQPRLFWITVAMAPGFLFNAAGVQHSALLQRELRYVSLSVIDTFSQCAGVLAGIALALNGDGYWALVVTAVLTPAINSACCWVATGWVPERPRRGAGVRSLLHFGGTITLNGLVVYIGYNAEKILLGRFWGADVLGLYTRAFQLINIPVVSINSAVGGVLFSALSRLQGEPARVRTFFLKGYSMVMAVTIPATMFSALFADDIVAVILGPKWTDAVIIFRLLTPTILIFSIINPTYWLLLSIGLQKRSLQLGFVIAPLVVAAYSIGLAYGPSGVAFSYSAALTLWLYPHLAWCLHGTPVAIKDILRTIAGPFASGIVATACAFAVQQQLGHGMSPILRFALGGATMAAVYGWMLLFVMGHRRQYLDVLVSLRRPSRLDA
jgi:PST family polysaccharide transporter